MRSAELLLFAAEAVPAGDGDHFWPGIIATSLFIIVFVGSVWLLTAMILGTKLGYYVTGACLFAVMTLLSLIWFVTALGPRGESGFVGDLGTDTAWHSLAVAPTLGEVTSRWGSWNLSDYPEGEWVVPTDEAYLADLSGDNHLQSEVDNARPVMDTLIQDATNEIPGIRERASERVLGEVNLESFRTTEIRMREAEVAGKDSVLAVGVAVPTQTILSGDLGGVEEAEVTNFLVEPGTEITEGTPVMEVEANGQTIQLPAETDGRLLAYGFRIGDLVKPEVPFATLDITGQPGAPDPVEVAAVRVRGSVRVPAAIYLGVSLVLMFLHLIGVSKVERQARLTQPQIA